MHKYEGPVQISSSHIKKPGPAYIPVIPALGNQRQEGGPGVSWSASPAESVSSRFSESPYPAVYVNTLNTKV